MNGTNFENMYLELGLTNPFSVCVFNNMEIC